MVGPYEISMKEVQIPDTDLPPEKASFLACLATILELRFEDLPRPAEDEDPATGSTVTRWLGRLGVGIVPIAEPASFSWPGPWIARTMHRPPRSVVMFGVPSGVVWDPAGGRDFRIDEGFLVSAADIATALPPRPSAPAEPGRIEAIFISSGAGEAMRALDAVNAIAGRGLEGDRYVAGDGTFPSGQSGSALTMIEREVCASFDPPLKAGEHRRNLVISGIDLNRLVGHDFDVGEVRCRGMRLCEPCTVVERYAGRPVLRALVHRGGIRADIISSGAIRVGDQLRAVTQAG
jgi:MOSC domain-containing protein YiiM